MQLQSPLVVLHVPIPHEIPLHAPKEEAAMEKDPLSPNTPALEE